MEASLPAASSVPGDLPVVDLDRLRTFTDGDHALETELADLFLTTAAGYLARMEEAVTDQQPWTAEAHALKGASGNLGARRVAALARDAEFSPPSSSGLAALRTAVEEVRRFFADRKP